MNKKLHVHFAGIGGSALSGIAIMAKDMGFDVSGCDLEDNTAYIEKVKKKKIKVFLGHNFSHLKGVDVIAVSPAVFFQSDKNQEFKVAEDEGKLVTWDKFVGDYFLPKKESICITGTHGKSTTTTMAGLVFENAKLDPSVIVGATVKQWGTNYRVGKSDYFIIEADDFYEKFLNYEPSTAIINNIEFDHPDFFKSESDMVKSYVKFVKLLEKKKNLIINQDSNGNEKLLKKLGKSFLKGINTISYTFEDESELVDKSVKAEIIKSDENGTYFRLVSHALDLNDEYHLSIPGKYKVANATGVIILSKLYAIDQNYVKKSLSAFSGAGRRLDYLGEKNGIKVYDDYAHHPTAIEVTLQGLRQKYLDNSIWCIDEPHSFSRTKALLKNYKGVFDVADRVIIGPIFKARDTKTFGVTGESIVKASKHRNIKYLDDFEKILAFVKNNADEGDIIIVMGAGLSYKWSRRILEAL